MPRNDSSERIAIVGIGGIFPGAPDLSTFWENIAAGKDAGRPVPEGRWYLSPDKAYAPWPPQPDRVYSTWGCFIEGFEFDPEGLDLPRDLLSRLDPMFHLGLHAARAAFRDSRQLSQVDRSRVGVILGNIALPTESTSAICRDVLGRTFIERVIDTAAAACSRDNQSPQGLNSLADPSAVARLKESLRRSDWHPLNRFAAGLPASLIAQGLGLGGIAFTLDAACASSLYSLKFAAEELLSHRADAMLAGGMSRPDCQYTQMGFAQLQALSRRGCCAPLSSEADGLVVGEGAGVFVLKRLSDAVAHGDHIYGIIAGIGLSNDRGANLLAPHSEGQLRAMSSAYKQAGWKPSDVDLIECHATGTPVGDAVEINSLHQLWEHESSRPQQCVIGGVKSNVGHLLTGAGAAGLMKVLLALRHKTLPPTANFRQPAEKLAELASPFRVLSRAEPWTSRNDLDPVSRNPIPRRATINAFGFGGINAHVLIEEWQGLNEAVTGRGTPPALQIESSQIPAAVVGIDVHSGTWTSRKQFQSNAFQGYPSESVELNWWGVDQSKWYQTEGASEEASATSSPSRGCGIADVEMPMGRFRIPPLEMQDMLPQQQLMLKVAAGAIEDAGLPRAPDTISSTDSQELSNRTGVFIGIELDPNTTNFHFRWSIEQDAEHWATQLGMNLDADQLARWISQLKAAAGPPLTPNRVMGNLGGIVASRLAREFDIGGPSFTISCGENSEATALELAVRSLQRGDLDRAIVGGVVIASDPRWSIADNRHESEIAFRGFSTRVGLEATELKETSDKLSPITSAQPLHIDVAEAFILKRRPDVDAANERTYAIVRQSSESPSSAAAFQDTNESTGIAGYLALPLLETYYRLNRSQRKLGYQEKESDWRGHHVATIDLSAPPGELRKCLPVLRTNSIAALEICESTTSTGFTRQEQRRPIGELPAALFVIDGDSTTEIEQKLNELALIARSPKSAEQIAIRWFQKFPPQTTKRLALTLVAGSSADLLSAIERGRERLRSDQMTRGFARDVHCTPRPLAGRVAFVFPGSGNAFRQMGRTLLSIFPEALRRQLMENRELGRQIAVDNIWFSDGIRSIDHKSMIFSQVAIGSAVCDLLSLFGIQPSASVGYSLGESAALFGLRAWTERDEMLERMHRSPLFGSDLVAPFEAARKAWNIPENEAVQWRSGLIDRSADDIRGAIERICPGTVDSRVYLLIVNTPRQCVIGGERELVDRLVNDLEARFVPLGSPSTVHCKVLRQVEAAYLELHLMRTTPPMVQTATGPKPIDYYSAATGRKYELTRQSAADAIVAQAVQTIDFPKVVEQAYADGARIFVEIGPGSSCARMIDEILGERPHFSRSVLPVTSRPVESFLELLAALISERVPVDLSYLYGNLPVQSDEVPPMLRMVKTRVGGLPYEIPAPADGWRFQSPPGTSIGRTQELPRLRESPPVITIPEPVAMPLPVEIPDPLMESESPVGTVSETAFSAGGSSPQNGVIPDFCHRDPEFLSLWDQFQLMTDQRTQAHEVFLRLSARYERLAAEHLARLAQAGQPAVSTLTMAPPVMPFEPVIEPPRINVALEIPIEPPRALNRQQCMEFAIGKIGRVLGQKFAAIDAHPTRVRLPDEPLMLVDRILNIEGEPLSMTSGRVVTEHDIHPGAWYLDCGRIPTCIAVESGQADLFLSGWLGIDFETKGLACYRLLDAVVTFHDALPQPGKTINYDIRVLHFFRQGSTFLFRFEFDATVDGRPLLTMREGCAGFFTEAELAGGKGIVHTALDKRPRPGVRPDDWSDPVPMTVESYDDDQLLALRRGHLASCFGPAFESIPLQTPVTIPGLVGDNGDARGRMWLVDRILKIDPTGGKFGLGTILGELDIHPDDWFLTCHFCDDQVMPGTLMYECCMHTLRVYLLRMGWIGEARQVAYEPIPEVRSRLKCRGQVLAGTKKVWYEVTLKEVGYGRSSKDSDQSDQAPYCLADALMYADGKPIVEITDMSVRLSGLTRDAIEALWQARRPAAPLSPVYDRRPAIFDTERITAFAIGKPSEAFGDRYLPFDGERKIARLPGPPFQFLDRVVSIQNCQPWVLQAGGEIVAQYDVPVDAWYFASNRQPTMPFAVLLETSLQPCGWLAGYLGSALTSDTDLSFRNLGGTAIQYREVTPTSGTLSTTVKMTRVSNSAGMIIQHYDFDLRCGGEPVYVGNTYFGFFSKAALANQIGIREAIPYQPSAEEKNRCIRGMYPQDAPFPDPQFRMIQRIECLVPDGGPYGKGCVIGTMPVDPEAWFFKAHFYEDPVVPGSLGLESFWQLVKVFAAHRWQLGPGAKFFTPAIHETTNAVPTPADKHEWVYRGQVIPRDQLVTVTTVIRQIDDEQRRVTAEGYLSVDGRVIYQMKNFVMQCR
ncbi:MAG: beta-ketoacyl synthase N-terminal-like domain-containing protein [Planctomycetaceae bacterium]